MFDTPTLLRLGLRATQFACSFIALCTVGAGFYSESRGLSRMLGSHATNFTMLMTYTTALYSAYQIAAVEHFRIAPQFPRMIALGVDGAFALILLIAGIVLVTNDYVANCDMYNGMVKCGNLKAATVFTFLAMAAFIATAVLTHLGMLSSSNNAGDIESGDAGSMPYVEESTPKGPLSPIGGANPMSPSSKV